MLTLPSFRSSAGSVLCGLCDSVLSMLPVSLHLFPSLFSSFLVDSVCVSRRVSVVYTPLSGCTLTLFPCGACPPFWVEFSLCTPVWYPCCRMGYTQSGLLLARVDAVSQIILREGVLCMN